MIAERHSGRARALEQAIGARMRARRRQLALSQSDLAEKLGVSFQQVQKYERGANRVGASRLYDLSRVLDVPVSFFFDDLDSGQPPPIDGAAPGVAEPAAAAYEPDPLMRRETLELVRAYYRIPDPQIRRRLFDLTKAIANACAAETV